MSDYRPVWTRFWNDPLILQMKANERYIYHYLLDSPLSKLCGIYEISIPQISYHTGLENQTIYFALKELADTYQRIGYDEKTNTIYVINALRYNCTASPTLIAMIRKQIEEAKVEDYKKDAFMQLEYIEKKKIGIDRVSIPYGYRHIPNHNPNLLNNITNTDIKEQGENPKEQEEEEKSLTVMEILKKYERKPNG